MIFGPTKLVSSFGGLGSALLVPLFLRATFAGELEWRPIPHGRVATVNPGPAGRTGFTPQPNAQTGIAFTNTLSFAQSSANQNLLNGAGLAVGDYDGDGLCDVYFCNLEGPNALYRNLGGWRFTNQTEAAGVACADKPSTGATFADVNGDGHLDLIVTSCGKGNDLFLNDGRGSFQPRPLPPGILRRTGSTSIALADIDGDGDLDLYIANYGENSILRTGGTIATRVVNGKERVVGRYRNRIKIIEGRMIELGEPDVLYLNDGQGGFGPVPWTGGHFLDENGRPLTAAPWDEGLSAMFHDVNGDGAPDLYVCNDFQTPDHLWLNDGHGRFRAIDLVALRSTCNFAMTVDVADIDRDGRYDLFAADMLSRYHELRLRQMDGSVREPHAIGLIMNRPQIRRNVLFWNRGDGTFADIANYARLDASDWTWCAVWLDVDLDGYEDLVTGNGHAFDTQDLDAFERTRGLGRQTTAQKRKNLELYPKLPTPNMIFRNLGNLTFAETGQAWGYASTQVTHSVALADFDNDGDLDLALNCLNAPPVLYRNDSPAPRVGVRLQGRAPNRQGIGAQVRVRGGAAPLQNQEIICGGHYLSGSDPLRVFATGPTAKSVRIEVTWRSGKRSVIPAASPNCLYEVDEAGAETVAEAMSLPAAPPYFKNVSQLLGHMHQESPFDDFQRQPLLHRTYSQLGPGVAWLDLDGDGHDELVIGAGRGGALAVYRGDGQGHFVSWPNGPWKTLAPDDLTGLAGWVPRAGRRAVLAGVANYEQAGTGSSTVLLYSPAAAAPRSVIEMPHSLGPLAVADVDGDGDLDVFAGGRVVSGRYPAPADSALFLNQNGKLELAAKPTSVFKQAGLVSGAVFSDLDGNGYPDLILACEWGPVRVFLNQSGQFQEATTALGLAQLRGWWRGVTTGDFNGDGRMDIVAANWGLNSSYLQPNAQQPLRLYYGDFDGNGTLDLLEAWTDWQTRRVVPRRDLLIASKGLPLLRSRFATHKAYAGADARTVIGAAFDRAQEVQANSLASTLFLNRGDHFEAIPLPPEAQFAPAAGVNTADFDGDGQEDIFLSQNFFAMRSEEPRLDAGRGLWLQGQGNGHFRAVPGAESGIRIYGEQRGSAVGDFDEDGRVDLVVTQNGAATQLYRNQWAHPGLRVRLQGPPGNPDGIGAQVRLRFGAQAGPVREIHGGSGYWSQDSTVVVLGTPSAPTHLWARWPGGNETTSAIPPGAREVQLRPDGAIRQLR